SADLDIIAKLKQADQGQHDLILLVRGGGSLEDLWCFNSEALVKTIYECESVVVVGVGHEPDHTLAEYVADVFAPTPSAAAELVTPNREDVESELVTLARKMKRAISHDVALHALALGNMKQHRYLQNPLRFIQNEQLLLALKIQELSAVREQTLQKRQQLDKIHAGLAQKQAMLLQNQYAQIERSQLGLRNATTLYLNQNKSAFASLMQLLDAYSPLHSIQRGYSVVYHDHHVVTSIHQVQPDDALTIRLSDGVVQATVCEKES
ncbi:MAG: exodeoxyribonuclease VII large subunit, partial [Erysipelotrichaceae bacterium]